jgi:hypothetical protein
MCLFVGVVEPSFTKLPDHLVTLAGEIAEREQRIDVVHLERELSINVPHVGGAVQTDLDPIAELESMTLEHRAEPASNAIPQGNVQRCARLAVSLDQVEVRVLVAIVERLDLALHPHATCKAALQDSIHVANEFTHRHRRDVKIYMIFRNLSNFSNNARLTSLTSIGQFH